MSLYTTVRDLDRRWVFLLMFLGVAVPLLIGVSFPEYPSPIVRNVFAAIEDLPDGSRILLAYDYDPGSKGELDPMAAAFTRHCAEKGHKLFFMTLWPLGPPMVQQAIDILTREYPHYEYGTDYVNFGFKPGFEGVIKVVVTDIKKLYLTDHHGTSLLNIPMTRDLKNVQAMDLIVNVSAGFPGTKEWVQYAGTPFGIKMVSGCTGVQAPLMYPYIPDQLIGVLGAIKAAAEYEQVLIDGYPHIAEIETAKEGLRRMGPQFVAHILIVGLIIVANIIYFVGKHRGDVR